MNKVILITGASSGIGKATALALIKAGHIVYGAARRTDQMQDIAKAGGKILKMDITNESQIIACIDQIIQENERIDVLINNAGYGLFGAVEDISIADARGQFEVNVFGLARITQLVLPYMRQQNAGKIINVSSMGGKIYTPMGAWYHASKHALEGWSDCLRLELKQFNIDVVIIEPGLIATEFSDVLQDLLQQTSGTGPYHKLAKSIANSTKETYGKKGDPSPPTDIADVIVKAVQVSHPKTRYAAGKMAKLLLFMRKYFGDGLFDKMVMSAVK